MRYCSSSGTYNTVYQDLVYGFFFSRYARNAILDSWKVLSTKNIGMNLLEDAIRWEPSMYPIENHLRNLDLDEGLKQIYRDLYEICEKRFSYVTEENLRFFIEKMMISGTLTRNQINNLVGVVKSFEVNEESFIDIDYLPFRDNELGINNCHFTFINVKASVIPANIYIR